MKPWLHYAWKSIGPLGRIGVWLLLAAMVVVLARVWPAQRNVDSLMQQLRDAPVATGGHAAAKPRSLQDFYRHFPNIEALPNQLAKLDAAAEKVRLRIAASQYQLLPVTALALQRYQVMLSISGDYTDLRTFLNSAMNESANAVFDETRFERDPKGQTVTAHLRISFYYRAPVSEKTAVKP